MFMDGRRRTRRAATGRHADSNGVQENDETSQDIFPESEPDFFSTVADDVLRFEVDGNSRAGRVILRTGGREFTALRID